MDYERDLVAEVIQVLGDIFASARHSGLPSADLLRIVTGLFSSIVTAELGAPAAEMYIAELARTIGSGRVERMH